MSRSQPASPLLFELGSRERGVGRGLWERRWPAARPVDPPIHAPNSEVPPISPKREPRFWNHENAPLIMLGIGLILVLIAAGIVLWVINVAPAISRLTGP